MAEYGEWNRKGAVLSDVTAEKEYGVTRDFIVQGIRAGRLEYRDGSVWGSPYLRILRSQLEPYIATRRRISGEPEAQDRAAGHRQADRRTQKKADCAGGAKSSADRRRGCGDRQRDHEERAAM